MKSVLSALFLVFLVALMVMAGCGSQDRYQVVGPGLAMVVEESHWADLFPVQGFGNVYGRYRAVEWNGDLVFGAYGSLVYRVLPEGYEPLTPLPDDFYIRGLTVGPDGNLWACDWHGHVVRYEMDEWVTEVDFDVSSYIRGIFLDHQGRVVVYGENSNLWRRDSSGNWERQVLAEPAHLCSFWCENGAPPVFVTYEQQLVEEVDGIWEISNPLVEDRYTCNSQYTASEDGRRVFRGYSSGDFLMDEGDGWNVHSLDFSDGHMFWYSNELYATETSNPGLWHWENGTWVLVGDLGCNGHDAKSFSRNGQRQILLDDGASVLFDGQSLTDFSPKIGECRGYGMVDGLPHSITSSGMLLQLENGIWVNRGFPLENSNFLAYGQPWTLDEGGHPVFLGQSEVSSWDGQEFHRQILDQRVEKAFIQGNGTLALVSDDQVGVLADGEVQWLENHLMSTWEIKSCILGPNGEIWILIDGRLVLVDGGNLTTVVTFQGWSPSRMILDPDRGLVIWGWSRLVVVDGATITDYTPFWRSNLELVSSEIVNLTLDGLGGWVAHDDFHRTLLHFDGQNWRGLDHNFWNDFGYGGDMFLTGEGTLILQDGIDILQLEIIP